jgi:hypothetical protein
MRFQLTAVGLACATLLAGCGGGGGGSGDGTKAQSVSFPFPGGQLLAVPPDVATVQLTATASGGGEVTYTSNTPTICTVNGATLSLIKAGECSVTASQAGGNGYAPATANQLFGIPKRPQMVTFRNPGPLPLDSTPFPLVGTSSVAGKTVTFTSSTPTVCTVSGNTMTKVGDGLCSIKAEVIDDIYAPGTITRSIPIGTAQAAAVTFLSGYRDTSHTNENGGIDGGAGTSETGWWCEGTGDKGAFSHCTRTVAADGSSFTFDFTAQLATAPDGRWIGGGFDMFALAPGVSDLAKGADTTVGLHIDAQSAIKFNFTQDPDWFDSGNNKAYVKLILGHHAMVPDGNDDKGNPKTKDCNVTLQAPFTPASTAPTDYSINLRTFTISDACGMTGLDLWNELQDYPIAKVDFAADSVNVTKVLSGTTTTLRTRGTLTGPITFQ